MESVQLVRQMTCDFEGHDYLIEVFKNRDGSYFARTIFNPQDVIISDGTSLEIALQRHRDLLPLAIHSRQMVSSSRRVNSAPSQQK
jgi:hypothetical protein